MDTPTNYQEIIEMLEERIQKDTALLKQMKEQAATLDDLDAIAIRIADRLDAKTEESKPFTMGFI